jgi:hypothetical protein
MTTSNLTWLAGGVVLGLLASLAITVPAHQGNPFLYAPGVFLGLVVAGIGSLVSLSLLLFFKKRSHAVVGLCACFLMMLAVLVLLPLVWPYSKSAGPKPLGHETIDGRRR